MGEAAPQAAGIGELIDWGELARLTDPVSLDLLAVTYKGWRTGQDDGLVWAVRTRPDKPQPPHSPLRTVIVSLTPLGLAEQLEVQERLRAAPELRFTLQGIIGKVVYG